MVITVVITIAPESPARKGFSRMSYSLLLLGVLGFSCRRFSVRPQEESGRILRLFPLCLVPAPGGFG